jgi:hypothetical protein
MLYREITAAFPDVLKNKCKLCGQKVQLINVTNVGTYCDHWYL